MNTKYKYQSTIPYSLHDMRVCRIEQANESLKFFFENGYVACAEPFEQVKGDIVIEGVDFDFCFVYLLSDNGYLGNFEGEKLALLDFIKRYSEYNFEIVDEMYGYNQVSYSGYLNLPGRENLIEMSISIYHFGDIVYETVR